MSTKKKPEPPAEEYPKIVAEEKPITLGQMIQDAVSEVKELVEKTRAELIITNNRVNALTQLFEESQAKYYEQLESATHRARTIYQEGVTRVRNIHQESLKAIEQGAEKRVAQLEMNMLGLQDLVKRELASQSCANKKLHQSFLALRIDTRETQESLCAYVAQTVILIRTWIEATLKPKLKKKHRKALQEKLMPVIQELMDNLTWRTGEEAEDE